METAAAPELATDVDGMSANVRRALTVGGLGAAALAYGASRASAAESDVLNLLAELENGAVAAYTAAAGLASTKAVIAANATVGAFLTMTVKQHGEVLDALVAAGATKPAAAPSAAIAKDLGISGDLTNATATDVINLAISIEGILIATASKSSTSDVSSKTRTIFSQLAASAGQRQAILRAVGALAAANALALVTLSPPVDASKLPAAAGSIGFPDAYAKTDTAITGA